MHGQDIDGLFCSKEHPDGDFDLVDPSRAADDIAACRAEVEACRDLLTPWSDLDVPVASERHGRQLNLRWVLVHLIEEYARHLGHMDLLREATDGQTGY